MRTKLVVLCMGSVALFATAAPAEEKVHELRASPSTVHRSFFDASLKPVLTIDSGDIVRLWTTTGNPRYFERLGVPKEKIPAELYAAFEGAPGAGRDDHTLDGPIEVRGAEIGDTVEIRIRSIDLWLPIAAMSFRFFCLWPRNLVSRQRRPSTAETQFEWSSRVTTQSCYLARKNGCRTLPRAKASTFPRCILFSPEVKVLSIPSPDIAIKSP